jgi:hypothetical protein
VAAGVAGWWRAVVAAWTFVFFLYFSEMFAVRRGRRTAKKRNLGFLLYEFLCRAPSLTHGKGPLPCVC